MSYSTPRMIACCIAILLLPGAAALAQQHASDDPAVVNQRIRDHRDRLLKISNTLQIHDVTLPATEVSLFNRIEIAFALDASYTNPYDPDDIAVDALITRPDGSVARVPAFYCEPYASTNGLTQMDTGVTYRRTGDPGWRVRYAPDTTGEHRLILEARDATGRTARSDEHRFTAAPSPRKGFVQVAPGNSNYYQNSADGSLFWGVGTNIAWTRTNELKDTEEAASYELYLGRANGKMTATRVWLCHWAWLEWTPQRDVQDMDWTGYAGAGYYNQMIAGTLDRVFQQAELQGLRIMLVTDDNNELAPEGGIGSWKGHPYSTVFGGPLENAKDIFTHDDARRLYRNRLRYIAARWGYSDALWTINSWNDMTNPTPEVLDWIKHMQAYVHGLFEGWRPIIYGTNFRFAAGDITDYRISDGGLTPGKPNVIQECFYTADRRQFRQELHEQLWKGLARGLAAIMCWDHRLVFHTDAWDEFHAPAKFVRDLPLHQGNWKPLVVTFDTGPAAPSAPAQRIIAMRSYGDVPNWGTRAPQNRFPVDLSNTYQWLEGFAPKLYAPKVGRDWHNPPVFVVDLPRPGKLLVEMGEIGSRDNTFHGSVRSSDQEPWTEAVTQRFEGGRRNLKNEERFIEIPLPAGPSQVMLDASGDWINVARVFLIYGTEGASSLAEASGWTDGRHAFAYIANQSYSRLSAEILKQQPIDLPDLTVRLGGLQDGAHQVQVISTADASVLESRTLRAIEGSVEITLPQLQRDFAIKILPAATAAAD